MNGIKGLLLFSILFFGRNLHATLAQLSFVKGTVSVERGGNALTGVKGLELQEDDKVSTGANSLALISFHGGSKLKLDPASEIEIEAINQKVEGEKNSFGQLYIKAGSMIMKFNNQDGAGALNVRTATVSLGVRGTTFFAGHDKDDQDGEQFYASVKEGEVHALKFDEDDEEPLPAGQSIVVEKDGKLTKPLDYEWSKSLDWDTEDKGEVKESRFGDSKGRANRMGEIVRRRVDFLKRQKRPINQKFHSFRRFFQARLQRFKSDSNKLPHNPAFNGVKKMDNFIRGKLLNQDGKHAPIQRPGPGQRRRP